MSGEETLIWNRFLITKAHSSVRFSYDLRIGKGISPYVNVHNRYTRDYEDLTKKRIDAVEYYNDTAKIYEVKQRGCLSALGQLIGYKILFEQTYPHIPVTELILLCSEISAEDKAIISNNNITVIVI